MVQPLHSYSFSSVNTTPRENVQSIPFDMQEKRPVYLEEVGGQEMKEKEIVDDTSADGLDRLVVLLNWTLLSAVVYMVLNTSYLFGAAFRAPFADRSTRELFLKLAQITQGSTLDHSFSATSALTSLPHYTFYRGFVYTSILVGFIVAISIILGKSLMGLYTLDLTMSSCRNPYRLCKSRRRSMPAWSRQTLESLPTALPLAQVILTLAILVTHHFAL